MTGDGGAGLILFIVLLFCYFLPTGIAGTRGRDGVGMIFLLNLFLGWTVLGWIILLVVAFTGESGEARAHRDEELKLLKQMAANQPKAVE